MQAAAQQWTSQRFRSAVAGRAHDVPALLELLAEEHPAYSEQSGAEAVRRRGWVLAALGRQPLPAAALPLVLAELQSEHSPYLLAAAARALRQSAAPPSAAGPALERAAQTLALRDDLVDLERWGGVAASEDDGSALDEVRRAQAWLAARGADLEADGDCCGAPLPWTRPPRAHGEIALARFEDQAGRSHGWPALFTGKPCIAAFFYTRCDNERKCSLTICKLAEVQKLLAARGLGQQVRINAISYDPDYDLPPRLQGYADSRRLATGDDCHLLRATHGRDDIAAYFHNGVNFISSIVNRHRIEVFLLDADGRIAATCQRLEWRPQDLAERAAQLAQGAPEAPEAPEAPGAPGAPGAALPGRAAPARLAGAGQAMPVLWAAGLALLPKCPICGVTYLSMSGIAAYSYLPGWSRSWPFLLLLLLLNLGALAWFARARRARLPLLCSGVGALLIAGPGLAMGLEAGTLLGVVCIAAGSLAAVLSARKRRLPAH